MSFGYYSLHHGCRMPMPNGLYLGSQGQLIQPVTRTRTFEWYGRIHPVFACQLMTRKRYKLGILRDGVLKDVRSSCMVVPEGSCALYKTYSFGRQGPG